MGAESSINLVKFHAEWSCVGALPRACDYKPEGLYAPPHYLLVLPFHARAVGAVYRSNVEQSCVMFPVRNNHRFEVSKFFACSVLRGIRLCSLENVVQEGSFSAKGVHVQSLVLGVSLNLDNGGLF